MIPTYLCREHPIETHVDLIQTCSDDEWFEMMTAKYGFDFETRDFTAGPDQPNQHSDRI
ncbi:hypothetical protein L7H23_01065 [Sphingopyxis sp. BSN-002]|uniref:hypothetical protein n=1 Tax=Sphingopyxis sp. BSN-002 TaxID=2911495 RepID=UPI001EDA69A8|nr:hypothetical protein [Sphingopyxis sp. BSN-002]UKK84723.1 hypothetical protein L7H23_01065 [Sphingopyxis sp. BSN-002]